MCLTAKPTWEWTGSTFQVPAVVEGAVAVLISLLLFSELSGP
jgi:hypothetical protein